MRSKKLLEGMQDENGAFSEAQLARLSAGAARVRSTYDKTLQQLQHLVGSQAGYAFHHTLERQGRFLLPNAPLLHSAISAVTCLVINSLREDEYGVVQKNIKDVLKSLYDLETALNAYLEHPQRHWSDPLPPSAARLAPVIETRDLVSDAFDRIATDFSAYLSTLHLADNVIERAHQVVGEFEDDEGDYTMSDSQLEMQEIAAGYRESPLLRFAKRENVQIPSALRMR